MCAVRGRSMKHVKCADALLRKGASVNAKSPVTGRSPLSIAIEHQYYHGYKLLILILLQYGADPNIVDKNGDSPLLQILYGGYEPLEEHRRDALALMFANSQYPVNTNVSPLGTLNTPLHLAVRRKDPYATGMLLENGADIAARNGAGQTAFALAVSSWSPRMTVEQKELARILLRAGADVNEKHGPSESSALQTSIINSLLDITRMLLRARADPYIANKKGQDSFAVCEEALAQGKLGQEAAERVSHLLASQGLRAESDEDSEIESSVSSASSVSVVLDGVFSKHHRVQQGRTRAEVSAWNNDEAKSPLA